MGGTFAIVYGLPVVWRKRFPLQHQQTFINTDCVNESEKRNCVCADSGNKIRNLSISLSG